MAHGAPSLPALRSRQLLSLQRRKAVRRVRDRLRNSLLAAMGLAGLVALVWLGGSAVWAPGSLNTPERALDERTREFATTRVGRIVIPNDGDEMCRELEFHNDDGTFRRGRTIRCEDMLAGLPEPLTAEANGRGAQVRGFFSRP